MPQDVQDGINFVLACHISTWSHHWVYVAQGWCGRV